MTQALSKTPAAAHTYPEHMQNSQHQLYVLDGRHISNVLMLVLVLCCFGCFACASVASRCFPYNRTVTKLIYSCYTGI